MGAEAAEQDTEVIRGDVCWYTFRPPEVSKRSIGPVIAHLGPRRMAEVCAALLFALGFDEA